MTDKGGPFIPHNGQELTSTADGATDTFTTQPRLGQETLFADLRRAWALLYRAGVIHKGLNADMLDGKHAAAFQAACDLLTAICAETTDGIIVKNGDDSEIRTIVGGTDISVTNGDGVSGNPTINYTGSAGASDFTDLGDVPASYSGEGENFVRVNGAENGLEFVTPAASPFLRKAQNLGDLDNADGAIQNLADNATSRTIDLDDEMLVNADGSGGKTTPQDVLDLVGDLTPLVSPDTANDGVPVYDASAGETKVTGIDDLGLLVASDNLSDLGSQQTAMRVLIDNLTAATTAGLTARIGMSTTGSGVGTNHGYKTLQQVFDLVASLPAGTLSLSSILPFNDSTTTRRSTIQAVLDLTSALTDYTSMSVTADHLLVDDGGTAKKVDIDDFFKLAIAAATNDTTPDRNVELIARDGSGNLRSVLLDDIGVSGQALYSTVIQYTGSGSSGKTVTLTGINRAHSLIVFNSSSGSTRRPNFIYPDGTTGTQRRRSTDGTTATDQSFNAPAAGTAQTWTINTTSNQLNASGETYRVLVIGTPI